MVDPRAPYSPAEAPWARFCPRCGATRVAVNHQRRFDCEACGFRLFLNVATGVAAVLRCGEHIAWIERGHEPAKGLLDWPGGFVDPAENLEEAVLREVREELAISLKAPRYLCSQPNFYPYAEVNYRTVDVFFGFELDAIPSSRPNDEVGAVHWLLPSAVPAEKIAFQSVRHAWRWWQAAFAKQEST